MIPRWPATLMYHAIARVEEDPSRLCVSPQQFESQMLYLKRRKLRGVSVRELRRAVGTKRIRGLVGLTFDDGYENFLHDALPVLERLGFSATVFVVAGMMGELNKWDKEPRMKLLTAEGVREVAKRGIEVGSHGLSHLELSGLQATRLEKEVSDSRRILSKMLGEEVEGFCYPYGRLDDAVVRSVRRAGYSYACALRTRVEHSDYDLLRAPVREQDGPLMIAGKLSFYPLYAAIARTPPSPPS